MARSRFLLFKRKLKRKTVYYVKFWLPQDCRYTIAKSIDVIAGILGIDTKQWSITSKAGARHIAQAWIDIYGSASRKNDPLLWDYCLQFWDWEKSEYIKGKRERGQQIGRQHCASSYYKIKEYVQPRTYKIHLSEVTASVLDNLQLKLRQELPGQSSKSINAAMAAVCTPIREAYRLGKIPHNPAHNFRNLANNYKKRGILSTTEIKALFSAHWEYEAHCLAVALGYETGMRLGEVMAATIGDLAIDMAGLPLIWVKQSFSVTEGLKETKNGKIRVIPISTDLENALKVHAGKNPHSNGFIFWSTTPDKPLSAKIIERGFNKQLHKIGIDEKTRKERVLSYHSLRHGFNSALRGSLHDKTLRLATGHLDPGMSDLYDHATFERLAEIRAAQEVKILPFRLGA